MTSDNDSVNGDWTYDYDAMNRIVQANCVSGVGGGCDGVPNGNGLSFVYDRFGSLWQENYVNGGQAGLQYTFGTQSNRADQTQNNSDGDGLNLFGNTLSYDAENQLVQVDGGQTASYTYFPSGNRATKTVGGVTYWYLWDDAGHELAKLSNAGAFERGEIYAGGRHLGSDVLTAGGRTDFSLGDWLGSTRVVLDTQGNVLHTCGDWPYGYNRYCPNGNPSSPMQYTGKPHDSETGLDNFGARMYISNLGRFMTPDWSAAPAAIPYAKLANPQSLNLYTYTLDNPVTNTDSNGHVCVFGIGNTCGKNQTTIEKHITHVVENVGTLLTTMGTPGSAIAFGIVFSSKPGSAGGASTGKLFSKITKEQVVKANQEANNGQTTCENCGQSTVPGQQSQSGVTPSGNEIQIDHVIPRSQGGNNTSDNAQVLCRSCNVAKSNSSPVQNPNASSDAAPIEPPIEPEPVSPEFPFDFPF